MKLSRFFRGSLVALSTVGLLVPQAGRAVADESISTLDQVRVTDVALHEGGVLEGQVVNAEGVPQSGVDVTLETRGNQVARTTTDEDGRFAVAKLRGGTYQVGVGEDVAACRVWAANTAPPSASPGLLVVTGDTARGQGEIIRRYGPGAILVLGGLGAIIAVSVTNNSDGS